MKSEPVENADEMLSDAAAPELTEATCPACGATEQRAGARFCATCGRDLDADGYLPADALRSSYHYQRTRLPTSPPAPAVPGASASRAAFKRRVSALPDRVNANGAAKTALAFVTYSLVPYLGILFCPGALLMGGVALMRSRRTPQHDGRRAAFLSIASGLVILVAQLLLWWILYKVPEWTRPDGF